jgi:hypothetical protein
MPRNPSRPVRSRPEGYTCPHRHCGRWFRQIRHYQVHVIQTHHGVFVPAAEYRPPTPPQDPPPQDPPPQDPPPQDPPEEVPPFWDVVPKFWDWGPSARHDAAIGLLDHEEVTRLDAGTSLVEHMRKMMQHIELESKPILESITPGSAVEWPPLQEYTSKWKHLQEGADQIPVSQQKEMYLHHMFLFQNSRRVRTQQESHHSVVEQC